MAIEKVCIESAEVRAWAASDGVIRRPEEGPEVELGQKLLHHFGIDCGDIDADFGGRTEAGWRRFQRHRLLDVDGRVGAMTKAEVLRAFEHGYTAGEPFPYPANDSSLLVYGGIHPTMGRLPDDGGRVSWFGGPDDAGDRIYGQALVPAKTVAELYERHPELVKLGLFREGLSDPLPMTTDWKGRRRQAGISWCLDPMSFYLAMRWEGDDRRGGLSPLHTRVGIEADGKVVVVAPTDYGPAEWTGKDADLSLGAIKALGLTTGDRARFFWVADDAPLGLAA